MRRPAITRKGYFLLAKALYQAYRHVDQKPLQLMGMNEAAVLIADALSQDNPCFDRDYFLAVVWGEANLSGL